MPSSNALPSTSQAAPDLDALVMLVAALNADLKQLKADYDAATAQLLDAHAQGLVRSEFTAFDTAFKLTPGRSSWAYDSEITDQVKEIQLHAQQSGRAVKKTSTPFWTLRATRKQ